MPRSVAVCSGQKVHLVSTGALTNVALLLLLYPEASKLIEQIVIMGGAIGPGNTGAAAEFNMQVGISWVYSISALCLRRWLRPAKPAFSMFMCHTTMSVCRPMCMSVLCLKIVQVGSEQDFVSSLKYTALAEGPS